MPLFRECAEVLARYLATMFNYSMDDSILAAIWLLAMTIPIPKGIPKQWRPVVLEQTPVRIFEAVYNFKLVNYLERIGFFLGVGQVLTWLKRLDLTWKSY